MRPSKLTVVALAILFLSAASVRAEGITVTEAQALSAGSKLWKNECDGTVEGLTSWNSGEDFASLGIGHYIWYPAGKHGPFEESFPELVRFLAAEKVALPTWLSEVPVCPWNSREEFLQDRHGARLTALRELLAKTVAWQARFSANRLQASLPKMLAGLDAAQGAKVRAQFERVARSPNGVYALVDYVNFKGEGVLPTERYRGQGWGLLQVLVGMTGDSASGPGAAATGEFAASAARVLTERVSNSPPERGETRWLPGWKSRVRTYAAEN